MSGCTGNIDIFTEPSIDLRKRTRKRIRKHKLVRDFKKFSRTISASDFEKLPASRNDDETPTFLFGK